MWGAPEASGRKSSAGKGPEGKDNKLDACEYLQVTPTEHTAGRVWHSLAHGEEGPSPPRNLVYSQSHQDPVEDCTLRSDVTTFSILR